MFFPSFSRHDFFSFLACLFFGKQHSFLHCLSFSHSSEGACSKAEGAFPKLCVEKGGSCRKNCLEL
ncbi:MAG: hypothetical protein AAGF04_04420 [Chlamydiota bacterium]